LVDKSAIYVLENGAYVVKKVKGCKQQLDDIKVTAELNNLAVFYGNVLTGNDKIANFFEPKLIELLSINTVVPLIIEGDLYGFILMHNKTSGEDDYIISEALMRLINNALGDYSRYEKLEKVNHELDEKIFNLFAINQSSKVLLSDLRMEALYNISVDVFSELTRSKFTGFVLYDERSCRYVLKGFKDVFYKTKDVSIRLMLKSTGKIDPNKVIINLNDQKDCEYFYSLFEEDYVPVKEQLAQLDAIYIVLILKNNQILGFVTLSQTVTDSEYSDSIFELIESLSASTYIALTNAKLFEVVNEQKNQIQKKLDKLISLSNLTKNISNSVRTETLIDVASKTLQISFNVEKAAFCLYKKDSNEFEISKTIGLNDISTTSIIPNENWKRIYEGDHIYVLGQKNIAQYVGEGFAEEIGDGQGVLVVPIYLDMLEIELLGALVIFKYTDLQLDNEENLLILDTIAGNIAPVLNNLLIIQMQQRFLLPNYIELFKKDLKEEIKASSNYRINLSVLQIQDERDFIFRDNCIIDILKENFHKVYPFSYNNVFLIENIDDEDELFQKIRKCTNMDELKIKKMTLGKDFTDYAGFFELYK
jgi:transcriptional regulator with GAF, ATPase, and Fis domain